MCSKLSINTFTDGEFSSIAEALRAIIRIPREKLKDHYKQWDTNFNELHERHWEDFIYTSKDVYAPLNIETAIEYEESPLVGIDLPTLIGARDSDPRVMIVGLDPLRSCRDFPFHSPNNCIIGTPYAFHSRFYREGESKLYANIVNKIQNMNHSIYLTDIYKVWSQNLNAGKKISMKKEDKEAFAILLQKEIDIIKPRLCITFGGEVSKFLKKYMSVLSVCEFPHPAGSANGAWSEKLNGKCSNSNKLNYITQKIEEKIAY